MRKESKHSSSGEHSRKLCDLVLAAVPRELIPRCDSSPNVCGIHIQTRRAALYWLYHTKERVRIYLDCDDSPEIKDAIQRILPNRVSLEDRPFPRKGFAIRTPLFFDIETEEQARNMGPTLFFLSELRRFSKSEIGSAPNVSWTANSEAPSPKLEASLEGNQISVLVNLYERRQKNRNACIRHYGAWCRVCEFDFAKTFGEIGNGYIHVHHLTPLASLGGKSRKVDPIRDMLPVCPNCHEMLHQRAPEPYTIDELRKIIANAKA
jgi:hypothetical protein